jgi:hypothetical protein
MSSTDIQLYGNNAKSTLLLAIATTDTVFSVAAGDGAKFPVIGNSQQYFLVTLESAGIIEICKVTGRVGDSLTVVRGQEGTVATAFPIGCLVQMRVTATTMSQLARLTDRLCDVATVDLIPSISAATGNSYLCAQFDDAGNPILAVKGTDRWRYPTHSTVAIFTTVTSSTTTSITSTALASLPVATGRYIINFLTGALAGQNRLITSISTNTISWALATTAAPVAGTQFELCVSNAYQLSLLSSLSDESIINALVFGG